MRRESADERIQKSPKGRFLHILGIVFFLIYFVLGLVIVFWKDFPIVMDQKFRIAFGILLIVYSFLRFIRLIQKK